MHNSAEGSEEIYMQNNVLIGGGGRLIRIIGLLRYRSQTPFAFVSVSSFLQHLYYSTPRIVIVIVLADEIILKNGVFMKIPTRYLKENSNI